MNHEEDLASLLKEWNIATSSGEGEPMNSDQFKGKWMQFKGELKQQWGKFTDDDLQQIKGNYDKFIGKVQERYGEKKDALMKWAASGISGLNRKPRRKRSADGPLVNSGCRSRVLHFGDQRALMETLAQWSKDQQRIKGSVAIRRE
jgi:uncharacterized protein YjbJ (UPF0337 family)